MSSNDATSVIATCEDERTVECTIELVGPLTLGARLIGVTPKDSGQILMLLDHEDQESGDRLAEGLDLARSEASIVTLVCVPAPPQWSRGIVKDRILRIA